VAQVSDEKDGKTSQKRKIREGGIRGGGGGREGM